MSLFTWDDKYTLHIAEIDRQHQKLFALFNDLYDAMQDGHGQEVIDKVLTGVVDYTVYHFDTEEKLLRQYGYQDEAAHRAEHAKLAEQAKALVLKHRAGEAKVTLATLKFLCDWLNNHILGTDKKFAPFLIERGAR
ncbi:bacteriohemerythrin [Ramlibacter sp. RBP-2]|uniref:Bacteriohemerythrin n=1 Tax=Ramlibacter lithotrophicus TaxID=2606681 RepID=A0A7X6DGM9_9BURK|nr:bacteriohemerythrin [Ramlibacter lithotrophicus]NKE66811.1 bacteriohemerythrin [Ramlibacter lithotrophicus]